MELVSTDLIIDYASNPRKNNHAVDAIAAAINEYGFNVPILLKRDNTVIDGHLRLKAAKKLKMDKVPAVYLDNLTENQIKAFRISVNKMAELAQWDEDLLQLEIGDLKTAGIDLAPLGFSDAELDGILEGWNSDIEMPPSKDDDFNIDSKMVVRCPEEIYDEVLKLLASAITTAGIEGVTISKS